MLTDTNPEFLSKVFRSSLQNNLELPDARLNNRCIKILEVLKENPNLSFPQAFTDKHQLKLLYRFLSNPKVSSQDILSATYADTLLKLDVLDDELVLVAQDTSEFDFTTKPETKLGYLHKLHHNGFLCHSGLAISPTGLPVGLLFQKNWTRDRNTFGKKKDRFKKPITEKESYRWLECLEHLEKLNQDLTLFSCR